MVQPVENTPVKPKVLVVEDNEALNFLICRSLFKIGCETSSAQTGMQAIEYLRTTRFDLIVLDFFLPDFQARELVEKYLTGNDSVPFLVLTGHGDERIAVEMMKLGARDYLIKDEHFVKHLPRAVDRILKERQSELRFQRVQTALDESRERLDLAIEVANLGFFDVDVDKGVVIFNHFWEKLLGISEGTAFTLNELNAFIEPDDREEVQRRWGEFIEGTTPYFKAYYRIRSVSGKVHWINDQGRWVQGNHSGEGRRAIRTQYDRTEAQRAEEERVALEKQLRHSQKLETIGTLAGGIAHDFNNILAAIYGFTELLLKRVKGDASVTSDLNNIVRSVKRARTLVKQILLFSRQEEADRQVMDLGLLINEVITFLRPSLPSTVEIKKRIHCDTSFVLADPTQIHQVLVNLATNASQALIDATGTITISLRKVTLDAESKIANLSEGEYLRLTVEDDGEGIEPEIIERIFEPFFTTKEVGEGSGLGLSVVHGIIEQHNGNIVVASSMGKGTTFTIHLPVSHEKQISEGEVELPIRTGKGRLLLVDDEPTLTASVSRVLNSVGYEVDSFTDPKIAAEVFEKNPDAYALVLSDQTMPNLTGLKLTKRLREARADIPVILITGYLDSIATADIKNYNIDLVLQKPFGTHELANSVAGVLDAVATHQA